MSGSLAPASLFGKLPSRGDFVRLEMVDDAGRALESWLTDSVERSQGEVPTSPVRFLFTQGEVTLLGAWQKSRDEIGRTFPLVAFFQVSEELTGLRWSLLPAFFDAFLTQIETVLAGQLQQTPEDALAAVRAVTAPHPSELVKAIFDAQAYLAQEPSSAFAHRVFGAEAPLPMPYALFTLREACARATARPTLDLPLRHPHDTFVWLELLDALATEASQSAPAFVWTASEGRALASFEQPSELTCSFLLDPKHGSSARWPVSTTRVDGREALAQLPPAVQSALSADVALQSLISSLKGAR